VRTIQHVGFVAGVTDDRAEVHVWAPGRGAGCRLGCAACSTGRGGVRKLRVARADLQEGDYVRVTMPACSTYVSALVVFALPMALFVVGAALGARFEPAPGGHGAGTIAGALAGLAAAVVIAVFVNRKVTGDRHLTVTRMTPGAMRTECRPPPH